MAAPPLLSSMSVTQLRGVGPRLQERLNTLHIGTVQDLLFHLPLRYQDRTRVVPIGRVRLGQDVMLEGEMINC